jgi:hypothetical protein
VEAIEIRSPAQAEEKVDYEREGGREREKQRVHKPEREDEDASAEGEPCGAL